jgi:hypothetical protein
MTSDQARALVQKHGILLETAHGPVPSLAELIVGTAIRGSWWSHPKGREIFALTRAVRDSKDVLVCRLVGGKVTFVHRRVWPALVRAAGRFPTDHLSRLREIHTRSGRHVIQEMQFPEWVPAAVRRAAQSLSEEAAIAELPTWTLSESTKRPNKRPQRRRARA